MPKRKGFDQSKHEKRDRFEKKKRWGPRIVFIAVFCAIVGIWLVTQVIPHMGPANPAQSLNLP